MSKGTSISEFFSYFFGGELLKKGFSIFGDIAGEKIAEKIKERLPGFLGISLEDERIFEALRTELTYKEDGYLTIFLRTLKDYERNRFRNVVAGIPTKEEREEILEEGNKQKRIKTSKKSQAVPFLKRIAKLVKEDGSGAKARERCLSSGTIVENPFHQRMLRKWRDGVKWFKGTALDILGVDQLSDINIEKVDEYIKKADDYFAIKTSGLECWIDEQLKRPLWHRILIFWR
ncbi:MAG: hypothetical protein ABIA02_02555 [Candidatus Falkowbacteria bacterium]